MGSKQSSVKQQQQKNENNQTSSLQQQPNKNQINQQQQRKQQTNQQRKQQTNQRVTTQGQQLRKKQVTTQGQQLRNKQVTTQGQQLRKKQVTTQGQQLRKKQVTTQGKQQQKKKSNQKSFGNMLRKNFAKEFTRDQQNVSSTSITPQKTQTQTSKTRQQRQINKTQTSKTRQKQQINKTQTSQTQQEQQNMENERKQNMFNIIKSFICNSTNPVVQNKILYRATNLRDMQFSGLENILRNFRSLELRPSHGMGIFSNIDLKAGDEIIIDFNTRAYNSSKDTAIKEAIEFYGDEYKKTHALSQSSLFPIAGLLNYSDNPNCLSTFVPFGFIQNEQFSYEVSITHCIKDIETGEELTVPYQPGFAQLVEGVINYHSLDDINFNDNEKILEKLSSIDELLKRMIPSHYKFIDNRRYDELFLYLCENLIMKIGYNNFSENEIVNEILRYDNVYLGIQSMAFLQKLIEIYGEPSSSTSSNTSSTASPFASRSNLARINSLYNNSRLQKFKTLMRPSVFNFPDFSRNVTYLMQYIENE